MQNLKTKFSESDGSQLATLQTCIRTNDLNLLGDGTHLSSFNMLGNFHFGKPEDKDNYLNSCIMWDEIVKTLKIPVTSVHVHPTQNEHKNIWEKLGYTILLDEECVWSDGLFKGYCSELYCNDLEIGNLVNTFGYSVDVGFGFERLIQVLENKKRVDETSLFDQSLPPILRDVTRTLDILWENKLNPSWKGRNQVCRNLIRKILPFINDEHMFSTFSWYPWVISERESIDNKVKMGKKIFYRHREKPFEFFQKTYGISLDEYEQIKEYFTENGQIVRRTSNGS